MSEKHFDRTRVPRWLVATGITVGALLLAGCAETDTGRTNELPASSIPLSEATEPLVVPTHQGPEVEIPSETTEQSSPSPTIPATNPSTPPLVESQLPATNEGTLPSPTTSEIPTEIIEENDYLEPWDITHEYCWQRYGSSNPFPEGNWVTITPLDDGMAHVYEFKDAEGEVVDSGVIQGDTETVELYFC